MYKKIEEQIERWVSLGGVVLFCVCVGSFGIFILIAIWRLIMKMIAGEYI